jgi:ABC-type multidrug transport system permease subunit
MTYLRVFVAAFKSECKEMLTGDGILFAFVSTIGMGVVTAWILNNAGDTAAATHIYYGTPFLTIWVQGMSRTGLVLRREQWQGTLEILLSSRAPLALIMFSRATAIAASGIPVAAVVLAIIYVISGRTPDLSEPVALVFTCLVALTSVVATSLLFSPLIFMYARQSAVLNAVWPLGAALGGFLYSPEQLPAVLEVLSLCLPTSWAIEAVVHAVEQGWDGSLLRSAAICLALVTVIALATYRLFDEAERRARVTGTLAL